MYESSRYMFDFSYIFLIFALMIFFFFQVPNFCIQHGGHRMWYMLQNFCNKTILGFAQINSHGREKFWMYCLSEKETLLIIYLYRNARNICNHIWASILQKFRPSVCQSGYKRQKCKYMETLFSWPLIKIEVWFFQWTFLSDTSIYSSNILSIDLLVWLQKAKM